MPNRRHARTPDYWREIRRRRRRETLKSWVYGVLFATSAAVLIIGAIGGRDIATQANQLLFVKLTRN